MAKRKTREIEVAKMPGDCGFWAHRAGTGGGGYGHSIAEAVGRLIVMSPQEWGVEIMHAGEPFDLGGAKG